MPEPVDILIIVAHPDDIEFGISGSVARWVKDGKKVGYVICTNGDKGSSDPKKKPADIAATREEEQRQAAAFLGVKEVVFLGHPDQSLEDTPEFRKELVREIRRFKPHTVATTNPYRRYIWHRDHRVVGAVTLDAIFPFARDYHAYPDLAEDGFEPHKVKEVLIWGSDEPNYRVDITDLFETKLESMLFHKSQIGDKISPEMRERLTSRAIEEAEGEAFEMGEAFHRIEIQR